MTTTVHINAHAGLPVKVETQEKQEDGSWGDPVHQHTVMPHDEMVPFVVYETHRLIITELKEGQEA